MGEIINFPLEFERDKKQVRESIKELLKEVSLRQEFKDELVKRLLGVYEIYQARFSLKISMPVERGKSLDPIEQSIRDFEKELQKHLGTILLERMNVEAKLFLYEKGIFGNNREGRFNFKVHHLS